MTDVIMEIPCIFHLLQKSRLTVRGLNCAKALCFPPFVFLYTHGELTTPGRVGEHPLSCDFQCGLVVV